MSRAPTTRYALAGGTRVAYQVVGEGPDVVYLPANSSHIDLVWDHPGLSSFFERLGASCRVMLFDRRGQGMSDPASDTSVVSLEEWADDVLAVMDAASSETAALIGFDVSGPMALLLAATRPDRVSSLVLLNTMARFSSAPDYPHGVAPGACELIAAMTEATWGTGAGFAAIEPTIAASEAEQAWWGRWERSASHPAGAVRSVRTMHEIDVRSVVPTVTQPTLVLHARDNPYLNVEHGRWLAKHLAHARLVEFEGRGHLDWIYQNTDVVLAELEEFVVGQRSAPDLDRVLATVVFTDIVESTSRAASMGDGAWRQLLRRHDELTAAVVDTHGGRVVKSTGDGTLATFDGPARGVRAARGLVDQMASLGLAIRAGCHTGEIELHGTDIAGIAVHIAARISALAGPQEVLTSRTVKELVVGSGLEFEDRGVHTLKDVPDEWQLYALAR